MWSPRITVGSRLMALTLSCSVDAKVKLFNPNKEGVVQSNSAAFRLKLGTTNTRAQFVEVCSTAFKRNPALAGPY